MAVETIRPGYAYKSGALTSSYAGNHVKLSGSIRQIKIVATGAATFIINRESDSIKVDGEILADEVFRLDNIDQGVGSIGIKGTGNFRLWAYQ